MPREVLMPALGQTTDEMRIVTWLKAEGDRVELGEPLYEVETDKATLEVESYVAGTLLKIVCGEGESAQVGSLVAYIGAPGEAVPTARHAESPKTSEAQGRSIHEDAVAETLPQVGKVLASPVARQVARMHNIDIGRVKGSGPGGRIEKADVLALVDDAGGASSEAAAAMTGGVAEPGADMPVPRHRQVIAQRLTQSIQTIPQIIVSVAADMGRARVLLTSQRESGLPGLTYTHLILRSVARALREHPEMNRLWLADGPRYRQLSRADVGLAVAGDDSLLTVTIPEPDEARLDDLVVLTQEAARRARRGALVQGDVTPAAITVSNLGMHGVDDFEAIVDPAQTAILATGRIAEQAVVVAGNVRVAPLMRMSLTVDHRVADGVTAARFLRGIAAALEQVGA